MKFRDLPSVDEVAQRLASRTGEYPRRVLVAEIRRAIEHARQRVRNGGTIGDIENDVLEGLERLRKGSLRRVINATGVILHTNLGRAPLPEFEIPAGYSNLEYDLEAGRRGRRDVHAEGLLLHLTGKPGIVVNNNAAAVYLVLHELAAGSEVVVSRGQLIEIGDGFRIPDIMARAGVMLREVGTTNRTRIEDYRDAITERTKLLLIVHPSNFRVEGFTGQPSRRELVTLGRERGIPVYEDLGSGCVVELAAHGIREPLVQECVEAGVDVVSFSGDKLLGGPQCGIIAGNAALVERVRRNPMFRAFRVDKLILAALETTLRHYVLERYDAIPAMRMIRMPASEIRERSARLVAQIRGLRAKVVEGESVIGGGSTPEQTLKTFRIAIETENVNHAERRLREQGVIGTIENGRLMLDLRTVSVEEEASLSEALRALAKPAEDDDMSEPRALHEERG